MKKHIHIIATILLLVCVLAVSYVFAGCSKKSKSECKLALNGELQPDVIDDNYRTFYEIFVGGFSDSNGDGVGDLRGVINRLDYLNDGDPTSGKSLGINGIWLMPITYAYSYHKYDVADYTYIDEDYGTMDDMRELVQKAHERGINIIIDLVLNHTSIHHTWFIEARRARTNGDTDNPYYDFYSVSTEKKNNSWYSFAKDPDGTQWYYEGNFSSEMPELNWDNPAVKEEVTKIVDFWLTDVGIDGFRLDAVRYFYLGDAAKNIELLTWFREYCRSVMPDVYIVGEDWGSGTVEEINYYKGVDVFNFLCGTDVMAALRGQMASVFADNLVSYYNSVKQSRSDAILQPFLSNHDQDRVAGNSYFTGRENNKIVFLADNYKMAANMYILSPGSPFIYYGEEIGMKGSRGNANTDANRRLAMLWGDGDSVRNPEGSTFPSSSQINGTVADQLPDQNSLYNHYKKVIAIRNANPEIARGDVEVVSLSDSLAVCALKFTYLDSTVYVIHNIGSSKVTLDLSSLGVTTLRATAGGGTGSLSGTKLTLSGKTSAIIR